MSEKVEELAHRLIGTCTCDQDEIDVLTPEELSELDDLCFECEGCGWWCSTDELNDDDGRLLCDNCKEDAEDDEL